MATHRTYQNLLAYHVMWCGVSCVSLLLLGTKKIQIGVWTNSKNAIALLCKQSKVKLINLYAISFDAADHDVQASERRCRRQ